MQPLLIQNQLPCPLPTSLSNSNNAPPSISPLNLLRLGSLRRISTSGGGYGRGGLVKCMANPRRVKMVASQIKREISDMLLTDKVLKSAIMPEYGLGADLYLSSLTSISDVEVSTDLQVVKVYVSVFGDDRGREVAIAGLKAKEKYVRGQLGKRMRLRLTPEIRFIEDESLERGSRVIAILDKIKCESEKKKADAPVDDSSDSSDQNEDAEEWDGDGEGIVYVE
ncbi:unnamed protein product [Cuscuta campestris]|uniref:Ribosome-binding factor A n=1 Tax=Cuscuta campestris TaxID=132261 RepID=A0A484NID3_9ASTE|nr:unnamed protein product [Cuscuta campestris]